MSAFIFTFRVSSASKSLFMLMKTIYCRLNCKSDMFDNIKMVADLEHDMQSVINRGKK